MADLQVQELIKRIAAHTSGILWQPASYAPQALTAFAPYMRGTDFWSQVLPGHVAGLVLPDIDTVILIDHNMRTSAYDMHARRWRELSVLRLMAGYARKPLAMHESEWHIRTG
jgi:hypothetical protein